MKEQTMSVDEAANAAIFHFQLPTNRAIRFITQRAKSDRNTALSAIKDAVVGYKTKAKA